ncbi:MAG: hypothetical protein HY231_24880 [Acidobacteria bacterium]|nr:hypothetical protein [Acidobacteriota bacterium]
MGKPREGAGGVTVALWKSAGGWRQSTSCTLSGRVAFAQLDASATGTGYSSTLRRGKFGYNYLVSVRIKRNGQLER